MTGKAEKQKQSLIDDEMETWLSQRVEQRELVENQVPGERKAIFWL